MKTKLIAGVLAALLSTTALADTSSMNADVTGMGILENSYVRAGVNGTSGTFGSGGNTSPGLLFDSTGTGTFNTGYDYLTPGSPFDGFAVKIDGTNYANNNGGGGNAIANDGNGLTDGTNSLSWTGNWTHDSTTWSIVNTYTLGTTSPYVDITSIITAGSAATTLSFGRFIDPDARAAAGDSSSTDNVLGYGVIPSTNVAFSEALSSRYALGLYSTDTNVDAGISGWSTQADAYTENTVDGDGSLTNRGDNTIGLSWVWSGINVGDILTASYAYIFGPSAFAAASDAIAGGAGGGDTTTTSSWGTLTDVGSATDAASGAGVTLVSTTTETITSTSEAVSSTLPVLIASITTHNSTVAGAVQTIDRERTTTVTTPVEVTTTSFIRTTETYSDSTVVVTDGTPSSVVAIRNDVVSTITDPGSFVGRIDQIDTAVDAAYHTTRGLTYNGVYAIGSSHTFDNAMTGNTRGAVIGGTINTDNGSRLYGGFIRSNTDLSGNNDNISLSTQGIGVGIVSDVSVGEMTIDAKFHNIDLSYERTIGDFSNRGNTQGSDRTIGIKLVGNGTVFNPVIGYTVGKRDLDSFTETGSIQSRLTGLDYSDSYSYATIGGRVNLDAVSITALHNTDGINSIDLGIKNELGEATLTIDASRTFSELGNSNRLTAGVMWRF